MSTLTLATDAAIGVLVIGSAAVFAWFLADLLKEAWRRRRR